MDESIISKAVLQKRICEKAYVAFVKAAGRDSHDMNPGSPAVADFQAEYDRLELEARTSSDSHNPLAARRRVDQSQAGS